MKALFMGLFMVGACLANVEAVPTISQPTPYVVNVAPNATKVEITFGRASRGCRGFGVCQIVITIGAINTNQGIAVAEILSSGKLQMTFDGSSMDAATKSSFFSGRTFNVEEEYQITGAEAAAIGVRSYTIAAGSYPITASGNNYIVVF